VDLIDRTLIKSSLTRSLGLAQALHCIQKHAREHASGECCVFSRDPRAQDPSFRWAVQAEAPHAYKVHFPLKSSQPRAAARHTLWQTPPVANSVVFPFNGPDAGSRIVRRGWLGRPSSYTELFSRAGFHTFRSAENFPEADLSDDESSSQGQPHLHVADLYARHLGCHPGNHFYAQAPVNSTHICRGMHVADPGSMEGSFENGAQQDFDAQPGADADKKHL